MAALKQIVIDCRHPAPLARFWAEVLDDFEVRHYDDAEIARLADLGFTPGSDPGVILDGPFLEICFQRVDLQPTTKRPLHLDVRTDDREEEVRRLTELGASIAEQFDTHTWMRDPVATTSASSTSSEPTRRCGIGPPTALRAEIISRRNPAGRYWPGGRSQGATCRRRRLRRVARLVRGRRGRGSLDWSGGAGRS